jgi:hypothetical protein
MLWLFADGMLSLKSIETAQQQQQVLLGNVTVNIVDDSLGQFSLVSVDVNTAPSQYNHRHTQTHTGRGRGRGRVNDRAVYGSHKVTLSATLDAYSSWLLAIEDAIKVCHVKSLMTGPGRTNAAVQWYKQQHDNYERAMNTIEFGGAFMLHHVTSSPRTGTSAVNSGDCGSDSARVSKEDITTDTVTDEDTDTVTDEDTYTVTDKDKDTVTDTHTDTVTDKDTASERIWLQAEEEDTGLVFFPAGEDGSPLAPSSSSSSSAHRKKSVSAAEPLIHRPPPRGNSSGSSGQAFRGIEGGLVLPFHHILGVTKGTTEKVMKSNPNR